MTIFSMALVPEGNVLKTIKEIRAYAFRAGDRPDSSALPEGIFLGFYAPRGAEAGAGRGTGDGWRGAEADFARSFRRGADSLFEGLPPLMRFSSFGTIGGRRYIIPDEPFPEGILGAADRIAGEAGFERAAAAPLERNAGFFVGNDVTPPPFEAFSCRHIDAALCKIESADEWFDKIFWSVIARASRRVGPRSRR